MSLYKVYGDTYGTPTNPENFLVPNFIDRSVWGAKEFGYISGAVPNITGSVQGNAGVALMQNHGGAASGCFSISGSADTAAEGRGSSIKRLEFNASRSSSLYKSVDYVQPTSVAVRVKTRFV